MVAISRFAGRRLRIFYQHLLADFPLRLPFALGRRRYGLQHSYDAREALPVLRAWMAGAGAGYDRDSSSTNCSFVSRALELGFTSDDMPRFVSTRREYYGDFLRDVRWVLESLALADSSLDPPYWICKCSSNRPTLFSSLSSFGLLLRSSMAVGAAGERAFSFDNRGEPCPM